MYPPTSDAPGSAFVFVFNAYTYRFTAPNPYHLIMRGACALRNSRRSDGGLHRSDGDIRKNMGRMSPSTKRHAFFFFQNSPAKQ